MLLAAAVVLAAALAVLAVALQRVLRAANPVSTTEVARSARTAADDLGAAVDEFRGRVGDRGDR